MSCVSNKANFTTLLRYAQGWEDPVVSAEGTLVGPGKKVLTICGAGDFALWFLACDAEEVTTVDLNPVQLWALELRLAALETLEDEAVRCLFGAGEGDRSKALDACLMTMAPEARSYWAGRRSEVIRYGAGGIGRFEQYLRTFRRRVLPVCETRRTVDRVLAPGSTRGEREEVFERVWDNWRWRTLFRVFFSQRTMALLGRSRAQFACADDNDLAAQLQRRVRHALVELDPAENPFLQWILTGGYPTALPPWLTRLDEIRSRTDRLKVRRASLGQVAEEIDCFDCAHLSDVFEYMPEPASDALFQRLAAKLRPGGRLAYWNMTVPRQAPAAAGLHGLDGEATDLHWRDRAFFYQRFHLAEAPGAGMGATVERQVEREARWIPAEPIDLDDLARNCG